VETETCTNCLEQCYPDEEHVWVHLIDSSPECPEDLSPGTIAVPR